MAELLRALGHPARVGLVASLGARERTVGDLQSELRLDASSASQHLSALRRQGLVERRTSAGSVYYRVTDARTLALLSLAREILTANFHDSRALLNELDAEAADVPDAPGRPPA